MVALVVTNMIDSSMPTTRTELRIPQNAPTLLTTRDLKRNSRYWVGRERGRQLRASELHGMQYQGNNGLIYNYYTKLRIQS